MSLTIIGGSLKGRKLLTPSGQAVRPTAGRVREALFNILAADIPQAMVLDMFAGSGALGLEALSRGAAQATFLDNGPVALKVIKKNIQACRVETCSTILPYDATRDLSRLTTAGFNLVFMDPPYEQGLIIKALMALQHSALLEPGAKIVLEHSFRETVDQKICQGCSFELTDQRQYGKSLVSFLRYIVD